MAPLGRDRYLRIDAFCTRTNSSLRVRYKTQYSRAIKRLVLGEQALTHCDVKCDMHLLARTTRCVKSVPHMLLAKAEYATGTSLAARCWRSMHTNNENPFLLECPLQTRLAKMGRLDTRWPTTRATSHGGPGSPEWRALRATPSDRASYSQVGGIRTLFPRFTASCPYQTGHAPEGAAPLRGRALSRLPAAQAGCRTHAITRGVGVTH